VLFDAQAKGLTPAAKALDDALNVVQRASQTSAAAAVNKLAVRLSAGSDRLAALVRNDQDLAAEVENLDKAIIAAVSKEPSKRDAADEQRIRDRLASIALERDALRKVFAAEFPDYAALSNPLPLVAGDVQALLAGDEALVLFSIGDTESYVFALTRHGFDWRMIPLGKEAISQKAAAFRRGLAVDAAYARIYATSSVQTLKPTSVLGPKVWVIDTSAASRPEAISTRPMRGSLCRASNVYQLPPR